MNKRYDTTSALVRYIAGVFSLVAFLFLFGIILYTDGGNELRFAGIFFDAYDSNFPHFYGFIAQVLILLAGVFGVLIPVIGVLTDNEKKMSYIAGIILVLCGVVVLTMKVTYPLIEGNIQNASRYHLYGTTIAAGSLAILAGLGNIWAAYIKD